MAGEFSHLFQHPLDTLKEMGQKAAGEAAAAMVQRVQGHFGGAAGPASSPGGIFDKVMGHVAGVPHAGAPGAPHGHESSVASAMHIATAQISIGSASFAGFGGGGSTFTGSGLVPGAPGGSTGLFAPGGSIPSGTGTGASGGGFGSGWGASGSTSYGSSGGAGTASSAPAMSNFNAGSGAPPPPGQNKVGRSEEHTSE